MKLLPQHLDCFRKLKRRNIAVEDSDRFGYHDRGVFWIWCEGLTDETTAALDYWNNFEGDEWLRDLLEEHGLYFEWHNPGYATVWPNDTKTNQWYLDNES